MDELVNSISQKTGLPADKARVAVDTVVNYIKAKLPTSVASQVDGALSGKAGSSITDRIGGVFSKKSA